MSLKPENTSNNPIVAEDGKNLSISEKNETSVSTLDDAFPSTKKPSKKSPVKKSGPKDADPSDIHHLLPKP